MKIQRFGKFKVLVLACAAALTTVVPTAAHAATNPFAGNIRGTYQGMASGTLLICINQDGRVFADVENAALGRATISGTIDPATGEFSAGRDLDDVSIDIVGTATVSKSDPTHVSGSGIFSIILPSGELTGTFSGRGLLEVSSGRSISGISYFHYTDYQDRNGPSQKTSDEGRFVRLHRGGKVVGITATKTDGSYSFTGRPIGDYEVKVLPPGEFVIPSHPVKLQNLNISNVNFRSIGVYAYIVDDKGAGIADVPVRLTGQTTAGISVDVTANTVELSKRSVFFTGKGTFLLKPKAQAGFEFEPRSMVVTVPGTKVAQPCVRVQFVRKAVTAKQKAPAPSGSSF